MFLFVTLLQKYYANANIPVLVVGNKSELPSVRQDYILQPDAFCAKHRVSLNYCIRHNQMY